MGMFTKKTSDVADRPLPAGEGSSIGAGCLLEGRFVFGGPMMIRGHVKGDIRSRYLVVVEPGGVIEGRINVPELVVQGRVTGSVAASKSIEVWNGAELGGDVYTASLRVDDGSLLFADVITAAERPAAHIERANQALVATKSEPETEQQPEAPTAMQTRKPAVATA